MKKNLQIFKRTFDLIFVLTLGIVLLPVSLLVVILVRLLLGKPILFKQLRPGLHGKPFTILKFRTMTDERDADGDLLPDSQRLTRFGIFLRRSSLDELPELINVFKGDMSLVGPRPLLMEYLPLYSPQQARRHEVRPGVTGWAQVNGRQNITFSKRFKLDVWYVDNWSFFLDLKILYMTLRLVLTGEGVKSGQAIQEVDDLGLSVRKTCSKTEENKEVYDEHRP